MNATAQGAAPEPWKRDYIDEIVSPRIKAGQFVHHICVTCKAKLTRHERTVQRRRCHKVTGHVLWIGHLRLPPSPAVCVIGLDHWHCR